MSASPTETDSPPKLQTAQQSGCTRRRVASKRVCERWRFTFYRLKGFISSVTINFVTRRLWSVQHVPAARHWEIRARIHRTSELSALLSGPIPSFYTCVSISTLLFLISPVKRFLQIEPICANVREKNFINSYSKLYWIYVYVYVKILLHLIQCIR